MTISSPDVNASDNFQNVMRMVSGTGLSMQSVVSILEGRSSLDEELFDQKVNDRAAELRMLLAPDWPVLEVIWDVSKENWHLSLDGEDEEYFRTNYPDAEVVWVDCQQLHDNLVQMSDRKSGSLSRKYKSGTARIVAHLELGGSLTPPLIRHWEGQLFVVGGNHRLGWAKRMCQNTIPILIRASELPLLRKIITLHSSCVTPVIGAT